MTTNKKTDITITTIEQSIVPIAEQAQSLAITDDSSLKEAVSLLSQLNKYNDNITEEKEKVTKPLNEALKAERSRWKPLETIYQTAIDSIRSKMSIYQTELTAKRKADELAIAGRIGAGKGKLKPETAINKLSNLPTVEKEHATQEGLVQFRETPTLKINNIDVIPKEFFDLNETRLLKALKEGKEIPGAEVEIIQIPVNYR